MMLNAVPVPLKEGGREGCPQVDTPNRYVPSISLTVSITVSMSPQRIPSGNSISYGRRFFTQRDSIVATISVGYGDGFSRSLSNRGEVIIRGRRAKIVGTVCMDLTMVDCSDISDIQLGDEVTLIGRDGLEEMTPDELANLVGTISYEVTSSIGPRVPRIFVSNGLPSGIKSLLGHEDCLLHSKNG